MAVHEEVTKEATMKTVRALKKRQRDRHLARALPTAEETNPGQWWVLKETGCHPHMDDPLCRNNTVNAVIKDRW
jgi:hypothetical protein